VYVYVRVHAYVYVYDYPHTPLPPVVSKYIYIGEHNIYTYTYISMPMYIDIYM